MPQVDDIDALTGTGDHANVHTLSGVPMRKRVQVEPAPLPPVNTADLLTNFARGQERLERLLQDVLSRPSQGAAAPAELPAATAPTPAPAPARGLAPDPSGETYARPSAPPLSRPVVVAAVAPRPTGPKDFSITRDGAGRIISIQLGGARELQVVRDPRTHVATKLTLALRSSTKETT